MKTTYLLLLSLVLFVSTTKPLLNAARAGPDPVRDLDGKRLQTRVDYYILPVIRGRGGGLTLGSTRNKTCPLDVVQEQFKVSNGLPVTFSPINVIRGIVPVSTDLNIKFSAATICVQSTVWKLDAFDEATGQWFVTSGGVEGNPGKTTTSNWFKIEKVEGSVRDYKLVFCPTVCNFCKVLCRDVGIYILDGKRVLALSDAPFRVMFKKA